MVGLPDLVCPIPRGISHEDARDVFKQVRKEMPGLTDAAWRREAARRMGVSYDDYLKAWKKPTAKPVTPSPIVTPVTPRPTLPSPAPKPEPSPFKFILNHDTARAQYKQVKREYKGWTDAQIRREAARRMNVDYDEYLRHWKTPTTPKPLTPRPTTAKRPTVEPVVRPQTPALPKWSKKNKKMSTAADARAVNPGKYTSRGRSGAEYWNNCTSCTTTYELRRRGYDVVSRLTPQGQPLRQVYNSWGAWGKQIIKKSDEHLLEVMERRQIGMEIGIPQSNFLSQAMTMPVGARGFMTVIWEKGGAHIYNWEIREVVVDHVSGRKAKQLWFIDGQSGVEWPSHYDTYFKKAKNEVYAARVDELEDPGAHVDWLTSDINDGQKAIGTPVTGFRSA